MDSFAPSTVLSALRGKLLKNESLSHYTSWRTGGVADYLYIPADAEDLAGFLKTVPVDMPLTWVGLGSNLLVRDGGIEGVVIVTQGALKSLTLQEPQLVRAEAGVSSAQLARFSARAGLAGLGFMAGIPGTVGGALAMNAGCYGGEVWPFVHAVETIDRQGKIHRRTPADFKVAYRHVERAHDEWFIAGYFKLEKGDKDALLADIKTMLAKRNAAQPTGTANCGSVFRNPPGNYAGGLIEQCGLKGMTLGGASVSEKHANFIINNGDATSADIEQLINQIIAIVEEKTGIRLLPEVCMIGR